MKRLRTLVLALTLGFLAVSGPTLADNLIQENSAPYKVNEELVISGKVERVLTGERMVRLKTDEGAVVEVQMSAMGVFANGQVGEDDLTPGDNVSSRMHPGVLGISPASEGRVWITVDSEKYARLYAKDLDHNLFDKDERKVERPNGEEEDMSVSDLLKQEAVRMELAKP